MPKSIASPVKRWPGQIILPDALTYPQYFAFDDALSKARAVLEGKDRESLTWNELMQYYQALLPGLLACVEKWELSGVGWPAGSVTAETFPAAPRAASRKLLTVIIDELIKLVNEVDEAPNA